MAEMTLDVMGMMKRIRSVCVYLNAVAILMILFVLAQSVKCKKAGGSAGARIFAVNLMLFDLIHCLSGAVGNLAFDNDAVAAVLANIFNDEMFPAMLMGYCMKVQDVTFLVFNFSFVPMMVMTILACLRPMAMAEGATKYFVLAVLIADAIPIAFQVSRIALSKLGGWAGATDYSVMVFALYFTQLALTTLALATLCRTSSQLGTGAQSSSRKRLRHILLFSIAPCVVQVPFVVRQLLTVIRGNNLFLVELSIHLTNAMSIVFSLKPLIDALSILLFLGDYRRELSLGIFTVRRTISQWISPSSKATAVTNLPSGAQSSTVNTLRRYSAILIARRVD